MKQPSATAWQHNRVLRRLVGAGLALALLAASAEAAPVEWDRYSMKVSGKRVFLDGGEVHPFRMPGPAMWRDVLAKARAAGMNSISIYVPWQLHEIEPGRFRFSGRYDLEKFLRLARDERLYVNVRPGPYVQGEIDAGGYPYWMLGSPGVLRSVDPNFTAAWKRWYAAVMPRVARWQVGGARRGTVIGVQVENEFPGDTDDNREYMRDLVATAKSHGLHVPITHNDVQFLGTQPSRGLHADIVDVFAFDNYPRQFNCCPEWNEDTFAQVDDFENHYRSLGVTRSPLYTAEIQGGAAPIAGDDGKSLQERYRAFMGYEPVQQISLVGQGLTWVNRYMTHGGTTWGNLPFPALGTAYDYAAPIREWGSLGPRYADLRRVALQRAAVTGAIEATEAVEPESVGVSAGDEDALYRVRRQVGGRTLHILLRNADPSPDKEVALTVGEATTAPVNLPGHSARWLLANANLAGWRIRFTTAEVVLADRRHLVVFGDRGKRYELALPQKRLTFTPRSRPQVRRVGKRRLVVVSRGDAARVWKRGSRIVIGPHLLTRRFVETDRRTRVLVLGKRVVRSRLGGPPRRVRLPGLTGWRAAPDTSEPAPGLDDSSWKPLDREETHNQMQPLTSPVLNADDYGVPSSGFTWYRGRFSGAANGLCIEGRHRYHVWLNGTSVGTVTSDAEVPGPAGLGSLGAAPPLNQQVTLPFPDGAVTEEQNVIAVLVESWGHVMDAGNANQAKQARGLISASLDRPGSPPCGFALAAGGETKVPYTGGSPMTLPSAPKPSGGIEWRLRGGSPADYPNTSGLGGELAGWHRSRFDDSAWSAVSLPADSGGVGEVTWYRTRFSLRVPRGVRAPLGLELPREGHPAEVYLNGVHVARAGRDREERFFLPEGVVRPRGENVLAIARWNVGTAPARMPVPKLFAYEVTRRWPLSRLP
jgi:hypothetical protein